MTLAISDESGDGYIHSNSLQRYNRSQSFNFISDNLNHCYQNLFQLQCKLTSTQQVAVSANPESSNDTGTVISDTCRAQHQLNVHKKEIEKCDTINTRQLGRVVSSADLKSRGRHSLPQCCARKRLRSFSDHAIKKKRRLWRRE